MPTRRRDPERKRITFEIQAEDCPDVLPRVVMLFHRLNIEIQALYMVRRAASRTTRLNVTIEADPTTYSRLEATLYKIVQVRSVSTARHTKEVLTHLRNDSPHDSDR